jgi:hypothetical protein
MVAEPRGPKNCEDRDEIQHITVIVKNDDYSTIGKEKQDVI